MADGVNKAGKTPNTAEQVGSISRRSQSVDEIVKRAQQSIQQPIAEMRKLQQKLSDLRQQRSNLRDELEYVLSEDATEANELAQQVAQINEEYSGAQQGISETLGALKGIRGTTRARVQARTTGAISRFVSPSQQEARVRGAARSTDLLEPAIVEAEARGFGGLEQRRTQAAGRAAGLAEQIEEAQRAGDTQRVRQLGAQMGEAEQEAAVAAKGMQHLRRRGRDPESLLLKTQSVTDRATRHLEDVDIQKRADAGELRGPAEISSEMIQVASSLKEFQERLNQGSMSLNEFNEKAGESAERFEQLEREQAAVGGRGGFTPGQRRAFDIANTVVAGARAGAQVTQATQVDFRIAAMSNAAHLARQQNQQYDAFSAAIQGDMMAANMLMGGFENAAAFQADVAGAQRGVRAVEAGADATAATVSGVGAGLAIKSGIGALVAPGMIQDAAQHGASALIKTQDVREGVSEVQAGSAAWNAAIQAQQEIMAVPTRFRQRYRDFATQMAVSTRGAGGQREGFLGTMDSPEFIETLRRERIGVDQAGQLIGAGIEQMGADIFDPESALVSARRMERMGLGTMDQQFGRMGQLAGVGATDPTEALVRNMEEAVSRGFDNSKAVGMMVDATVSIAQTGATAQLGIDATGGITELLGRALGGRDPNRSSQLQIMAAQTAIQESSVGLTDRRVSFSNMLRDMELREMLGDPIQAATAAGMTRAQMHTLMMGANPENSPEAQAAAQDLIYGMGLTGFLDDQGGIDQERVQRFYGTQFTRSMLGAGGTGLTIDPEVSQRAIDTLVQLEQEGRPLNTATMRQLREDDPLAAEAIMTMGAAARLDRGGTGNILADLSSWMMTEGGEPNSVAIGDRADATERLATAATQVETSELLEGMTAFGENVKNIADMHEKIEEAFVANINRFGESAAEAVENMRNDINIEVFQKLSAETDGLAGKFESLGGALEGLTARVAGINFDPGVLEKTTRHDAQRPQKRQ
jgi:hypothetical protein